MTLLTAAQFREHVPNPLSDPTLLLLLNAAEDAITAWAGAATGNVVERFSGGQGYITLTRRASAVVSITERIGATTTTLDATDYLSDGYSIRRLDTGVNQRGFWYGDVVVTYTPLIDIAARQRAQVALVKLDLAYQGLQSHGEGEAQQAFGDKSYEERRTDILAGLREPAMRVLG